MTLPTMIGAEAPPPASDPADGQADPLGRSADVLEFARAKQHIAGVAARTHISPEDLERLIAGYGLAELEAPVRGLPEIAATANQALAMTENDQRYTDTGKRERRSELLAESLSDLNAMDRAIQRAQAADQRTMDDAAAAAEAALVPADDFGKQKALMLANRVVESGKTPAERIKFVLQPEASLELQKAVLFLGHEACGLNADTITHLRELVDSRGHGLEAKKRQEAFALRTSRRTIVSGQLQALRTAIVGICDAEGLEAKKLTPKPGRRMTREERWDYKQKKGEWPKW